MMPVFFAVFIALVNIPSALAAQEDAVVSATTVGNGLVSQSFAVSRHFARFPRLSESDYFASRGESDEDIPRLREPSDFIWNFGYSFTRSSGPGDISVANDAHAFTGGLGWEMLPPFLEIGGSVTILTVPTDNYRQGVVNLRAEYAFSFEKKRPVPKYDHLDARDYYRKKFPPDRARTADGRSSERAKTLSELEDAEAELNRRPRLSLPNLAVGLNLGFFRHIKQPPTQTTPASPPADDILNQGSTGLDVTFAMNAKYSFRGVATLFYYDRDVSAFQGLLNAAAHSEALLAAGGITAPSFPDMIFEQSVTNHFNERWSGVLTLVQTFYVTQGLSFSLSPAVYHPLGSRWMSGLTLDLTLGSLTALVGSLSFSYAL